jgi:hypothetical protein
MVGSQVPLPRPKRAENCPKFLWGGSRTHHALIPLLRPPHPLHNGTGALWDPDRTCSPGMYWVNWVRSCKPRRKLCDTLVGMRKPARSFSNEESHVQFLILPMAPHLNPRVGCVFTWRAIAAVGVAPPPAAPLATPCSRRFVARAWSHGILFESYPDDDLATIGGEGTGSRNEADSVGSVLHKQLHPLSWIPYQRRLLPPQKHDP